MLKKLVEFRNFLIFKKYDIKAKWRKLDFILDENADFIVSISSYPKRIHLVPAVFESLARQKSLPRKFLLTLTEEEWPGRLIPESITKLEKLGVQIHWITGNTFAVKNISPVVESFSEDDILILDDDIIYGPDVVSELVKHKNENKGCIIGHVAKELKKSKGKLSMWFRSDKPADIHTQSESIFFIGYSGIYYPKNSLDHRVSDLEAIKQIVPGRGKDIWLYCATIAKGTRQVCLGSDHKKGYYIPIPVTQNTKPKEWVTGSALDKRFHKAVDYFGVREKLLEVLPEKKN